MILAASNGYYSMTDVSGEKQEFSIEAGLEALLFVAPGPVSISQLASALETDTDKVTLGLDALQKRYSSNCGLKLQFHGGRVQLTTAPELSVQVERFLGLENTSRLSKAAIETITIVAYQQPITRPQIDAVRGVNSDGVLKSLLSKGLIMEAGRADSPGRPIMYTTSSEFLQYFGLNSIEELPPLDFEGEGNSGQPSTHEIFKD